MVRETFGEAIVIVLDVGRSVGSEISTNGETFLHNAQHCAIMILQRKILSQSKDVIGLVLIGSENTNNPLADDTGYQNIEIVYNLQQPSWDMVHKIAAYKKGTDIDGDWLDALIVAADFMKASTQGMNYTDKKIVMMTNFRSDVSDDEVNFVIQGLQSEGVEIVVIGPRVYLHDSQQECDQSKFDNQTDGEKLISRIATEAGKNSVVCSFEDAVPQLVYFEKMKTKPAAWRATLEIGLHFEIPIVGYKKIAEAKSLKANDILTHLKKTDSASDQKGTTPVLASQSLNAGDDLQPNGSEVKRDSSLNDLEEEEFTKVEKDRIYHTVGDDAAPVDVADIISGYMFGSTVVPVPEDDRSALLYESGPKCLKVLGFTNKVHIPLYFHKGNGCSIIFPEKDENCMRAFSALVQAMDSNDFVAVARRVYSKNGSPLITALFPYIKPNYQCLVLIELPYSEDVTRMVFPPLVTEENKPSDEQLEAVDQLITSMDLMNVKDDDGEPSEAYQPLKLLDPSEQHFLSVIAKKALEDSHISASYLSEPVKTLLNPKQVLVEAAQPALHRIGELFSLTEIKPKEGVRKAAVDVFKQDKPLDSVSQIPQINTSQSASSVDANIEIGTIRPHEDFKTLIEKGIALDKACSLLQKVIKELILEAFDSDDFNKPFKALLTMREVCKEKEHSLFNLWLCNLKEELPDGKKEFLKMVLENQAGLITSSECNCSNTTDEEAKNFLEAMEIVDEIKTQQSVDEDLDDLVNQM